MNFRNPSSTSSKLQSVFTYFDHYAIFRPLAKQGMAGSFLPAMTVWLYIQWVCLSDCMWSQLYSGLTAKKYISSPSLHSGKFSREIVLECVDRSTVDAIYNYSIEGNNSNNTWIINNRSLELSPCSNNVLSRYSVYGAQQGQTTFLKQLSIFF